ncbi:hypothetical protein [Raoultella terrigena]|jgi:hypothetical protein|uniref:hypothetical protein n=1 Tax=Raoultella terrigena TaxID=577 RepID=UPI0011CE8FC9|nr:hypothetical protein [Raoultella terrigena]
MQKWFYSWCIYTVNQSGGFTVAFAGSAFADFQQYVTPEDVLQQIVAALSTQHNNENVHIISLNRI